MFEFSKLTEDNIGQYMAQMVEDLKYLFTHMDENNMTADMRERWERVMPQLEELDTQVKAMQSTLAFVKRKVEIAYRLIGNIQDNIANNAAKPVGSIVGYIGINGAEYLNNLYGGTWEEYDVMATSNKMNMRIFIRTA